MPVHRALGRQEGGEDEHRAGRAEGNFGVAHVEDAAHDQTGNEYERILMTPVSTFALLVDKARLA